MEILDSFSKDNIDINLINEILGEDQSNDSYLYDKLKHLEDNGNKDIYSQLLKTLTELDFPVTQAKKVWDDILIHKNFLSEKIGRDIGFRVAMLDFFINLNRHLTNPKIIEIKLYEETKKMVLMDELTAVYNKRFFNISLEREYKQASRYDRYLSLLLLDIDNFKKINDTIGHMAGDKVLQKLGVVLKENIRTEDTVCRIGGEEFAIIMPDTNVSGALEVGDKIRDKFSKIRVDNFSFTVSGGIATYPAHVDSKQDLFEFADKALYNAKWQGKNQIALYKDDRRLYERVPINCKVFYRKKKSLFSLVRPKDSVTLDLSLGGISMKTYEALRTGERIKLYLMIDKLKENLEAEAKVVWTKKLENEDNLLVGAEFTEVDKRPLDQLHKDLSENDRKIS